MRAAFGVVFLILAMALAPSLVVACVYPAPLRSVNTTLLAVLDAGGTVSIHQRNQLARAVSGFSPDALKRTLSQDVSRGDARAARRVIDTATALASGRGVAVDTGLRDPVSRLGAAITSECAGAGQVAGAGGAAAGAEHGARRTDIQGGRALTFREGVARLSLTFTIYLVFLAFLLGVRRHVHQRARLAEDNQRPTASSGQDEPEPLT